MRNAFIHFGFILLLPVGFLYAQNQGNDNKKQFPIAIKGVKAKGYIQVDAKGDTEDTEINMRLRRARFQVDYKNDSSALKFQINVNQNGIILRDLVYKIKLNSSLGLMAGITGIPFGLELRISSSKLQIPDISEFWKIFDDKKSLLMGISNDFLYKSKSSLLIELVLSQGRNIYNTDLNVSNAFLGSLSYKSSSKHTHIGGSFYFGGLEKIGTLRIFNGTKGYIVRDNFGQKTFSIDSSTNDFLPRYYYSVFAKHLLQGNKRDWDFSFEYIFGTQSSRQGSFQTPKVNNATTNYFIRNFDGYYIRGVYHPKKSRTYYMISFSQYDRNTNITNDDINSSSIFSPSLDAKNTYIGLGLRSALTHQFYFTLYSEVEFLNGGDRIEDPVNLVATLRLQYNIK